MNVATEAQQYLHKTGPHSYDLTATHLMYLKPKDAIVYKALRKNHEDYDKGFHYDMQQLMKAYSVTLLQRSAPSERPPVLEIVDLGPGTYPDKVMPLIELALGLGIPVTYAPVDVSPYYLEAVKDSLAGMPGVTVIPLQSRFQDVTADQLAALGLKAPIIHLGPTYMNFEPDEILSMLARMMAPESRVIVGSELITLSNTANRIKGNYNNREVRHLAFAPLSNLGCEAENFKSNIVFDPDKSRIEMQFECVKPDHYFEVGDIITTMTSRRSTQASFGADPDRWFEEVDVQIAPSRNTALAFCRGVRAEKAAAGLS